MRQAKRRCPSELCSGESAGRFCPQCGRRMVLRPRRGLMVFVLMVPVVLALVVVRGTPRAGAAPRLVTVSSARQSTPSKTLIPAEELHAAMSPDASLPGMLALMTTDEARLSVVRSFAQRPKSTPMQLGELVAALPFFTTDSSRLDAVQLLVPNLDATAAKGNLSAIGVFFTTDASRASAVDLILRGAGR